MYSEERTKELRRVSGTVTYGDPLTSFLYSLMRDHLPAGTVEKLVVEVSEEAENVVFTNGWLAKYANNLAEQLKSAKTTKLSETLSQMFKDGEGEGEEEYSLTPERPSFSTQKEIEDELELLKEEIENAANEEETVESLIEEAMEESEKEEYDKAEDDAPPVTLDEAREMIDDIAQRGVLSTEKLQEIKDDLEQIEKEALEDK